MQRDHKVTPLKRKEAVLCQCEVTPEDLLNSTEVLILLLSAVCAVCSVSVPRS